MRREGKALGCPDAGHLCEPGFTHKLLIIQFFHSLASFGSLVKKARVQLKCRILATQGRETVRHGCRTRLSPAGKVATPGRAAASCIDFIAGFRFIPKKCIRKLYTTNTISLSAYALSCDQTHKVIYGNAKRSNCQSNSGGVPPAARNLNEGLKAERPHRRGPQPTETGGDRLVPGAFPATIEAARVRLPCADR